MNAILVVDDDHELRETVAEVLGDSGFEVATARDAESALELLNGRTFRLVLLDLVMPGMGGMAALPLFRRRAPATRLVMITAFSTVSNAVEAMRLGASDYITKPFKIDELLSAVRRNMEEANLVECHTVLSMDDTFSSLSNTMRRRIIQMLKVRGHMRFMDIARQLEVEDHTKVNFHLKVLKDKGLVEQDPERAYILSDLGLRVTECLTTFTNTLKG